VAAATALLDRGHGRPHMTQDLTVNENRSFVIAPPKATKEEWAELCKVMQSTPREQQNAVLSTMIRRPENAKLPKPIEGKKLPEVN
jgi:hypothetical protein